MSDVMDGRDAWLTALEPPQIVPSAVLYGIETWEVAHNRFMHWVLSDPGWGCSFAAALVEQSLSPLGEVEAVEVAREQVERTVQIGGRDRTGRLDEEVWLRLVGGERVALVIEMKLDALAGGQQLVRYVHALRRADRQSAEVNLPERVEGLLLRLTSIPDPAPVTGIGRMNLSGWLAVLDRVLDHPAPAAARVTRAQLHDYRELCRWLAARESAVLQSPWSALRHTHQPGDSVLGRYAAFVRLLISGAIAEALAEADRRSGAGAGEDTPDPFAEQFAWLGPKIATDRQSAYIDCAVGVRHPLRTAVVGGMAEPRAGEPAAVGFVKIRVKSTAVQIELQTIIRDYPGGKAQKPSRAALTGAWLSSEESERLEAAGWRRVRATKDNASRRIQGFDIGPEGREHQTVAMLVGEVVDHLTTLIEHVGRWLRM